jgi:ABC-type transport system substrate-binding protein
MKLKLKAIAAVLILAILLAGCLGQNGEVTTKRPFEDIRVRRAIAHAINKESIVRNLYQGAASVAKEGMPPSLFGYNDDIAGYEYDPEKAKQLLEEAGYGDGFKVTLWHMGSTSRPYFPVPTEIAEAIQADLGAIGIEVELFTEDWGTYLQDTEAGKHHMAMLGWTGDNGDPDNFLNVLYSQDKAVVGAAGNIGFKKNPEFQELLDKALSTYDQDKRGEYYYDANKLLVDQCSHVFIAHADQNLAFGKGVQGYVIHPTSRKFFYPVTISSDGEMIFTFGSSGDAVKLDPADVTDGESIQRMDNIHEGLVMYKEGTTEIEPCLATDWEISADKKTITFNLRKGVQFHHGFGEMTADDVVFSFARQYDENNWYHEKGEWAYWHYMFTDIESVEKIDDYTVAIHMKKPNASMLTSLAMFTVCIVSEDAAEEYGDDYFKNPVGTGPFEFVEWAKDDHIELRSFIDYWREPAKIDTLIFKVIDDPSARLMALQTGEVDGIEHIDPMQLQTIEDDPDLQLISQAGMNVGYIALNCGEGYVDDNGNGKWDAGEEVDVPGVLEIEIKGGGGTCLGSLLVTLVLLGGIGLYTRRN